MDRLLNYIFVLILVYVFALWAPASIHGTILLGLAASFICCAAAFVLRWLTLDGAAAAIVIGTITFGLGGWPTIIALLFFFISSALITPKEGPAPVDNINRNRRDGLQVWANGFWIVFWLVTGMLTNWFACWIAAAAAIATATADTWATELGSERFDAKTYLVGSFREVEAGTQGGVSWPGLTASLAGSSFIAGIAYLGFPFSIGWFICILMAGLAGSLFDSWLGASLQGVTHTLHFSRFSWQQDIIIDNNMVNWMATGLGSLLILILNLIIL